MYDSKRVSNKITFFKNGLQAKESSLPKAVKGAADDFFYILNEHLNTIKDHVVESNMQDNMGLK